ncbi:hypothetical protein F4679DRAFT_599887 [Xylaria curta]|nr:hypothetical protein F4679DRAFT_599887 [Xylaria curta]
MYLDNMQMTPHTVNQPLKDVRSYKMSYYPEYDHGSFDRTKMRKSRHGPAYGASTKKTSLARRQSKKQQTALFLAALLGVFAAWALRSLYPLHPLPSPAQEEQAHEVPRVTNTSSQMTPFWRDYRQLVTAIEDYDDWFVDVDAATRAIDTMWARVLVKDEEWHWFYQRLISSRAKQIDLAHAHWRKFVDNREQVIVELVGSAGALWRVNVDGRPVDDAEMGELSKRWASVLSNGSDVIDIESLAYEKKGEAEVEETGNRTLSPPIKGFAALRFASRRITEELVRTHTELFKDLDAAYTHMQEAEKVDGELKDLVRQMTKGWLEKGFWTSQMTISVNKLKRRMQNLRDKRETMAIGLEQLQRQFPADIENSPEKIADRIAWLESAKELLHEWAAALLDVQEGVLFLLRRRELPREKRLILNYVATWEAWKRRNCGGTSCYNAPGVTANIKTTLNWGKPVANVAQDEVDWIRSLGGDGPSRVWREVYEKACCQISILRDRIQHGSDQPFGGGRRILTV